MSLDSETKIALSEELEDVVMELVGISQLSPSQEDVSIFQSLQSEMLRLSDITEMYDYPELHKLTLWAYQNILALKADPKILSQQNEEGFFYIWLELAATLLREDDAELLSELQENIQHSDWRIAVDKEDLQSLIHLLDETPSDNAIDTSDSLDTDNGTRTFNSMCYSSSRLVRILICSTMTYSSNVFGKVGN